MANHSGSYSSCKNKRYTLMLWMQQVGSGLQRAVSRHLLVWSPQRQRQRRKVALGDLAHGAAVENVCAGGICDEQTQQVKAGGKKDKKLQGNWRGGPDKSYLSRARNLVALGTGVPANVTRSTACHCAHARACAQADTIQN